MKRLASILCSGLLLVIATAALANNPTSNVYEPIEKGNPTQVPGGWTDTGGETIATATLINSLPYTDSDNTSGHIHDYTAACGANNAPDLFYRYVPTTNQAANFSLCGSGYDTVLFILEDGVEIACNDDFCGLQSEIDGVGLIAGRTYIIGVSGFSSNAGPYTLNITVNTCVPVSPCVYVCPPGSQIEGEPRCADGYVDNFNGGCNSTPAVFSNVTCGYICGEMGTYLFNGGQYRDTDWYRLTVGAGTFCYNGMGENQTLRRFVLTAVCPTTVISTSIANCSPLSFNGPGSFYFFAGTDVFTGIPCGTRYWISFEGPGIPPCGATAVEPTTWGSIKNVYR